MRDRRLDRQSRTWRLLGATVGVALTLLAGATARSAPPVEPPVPPCLRVWPEARLRAFGYDHVVHLDSACIADAECSVATDVDPTSVAVKVPARTSVEIVVRVGSPAREFTPVVKCRVARAGDAG